jgi:Mrp family chromosome partitioning ATPase
MKSLICTSLKGGCGKTTVCAHLAKALKRIGYKVACLDLDYRAPNLPFLFEGLEDPGLLQRGGGDRLIPPVSKDGIPVFSLHYFWSPEVAVEVSDKEAIADAKQILTPGVIDWQFEPDYLVIDTAPETTGHIIVAFQAPNPSAIVISQPSRVSRADSERTICLLREKRVPILGIICNESYLENSKVSLFDLQLSDIQALADKYSLPKVWSVPHSSNLAPHFDSIVKDLPLIKPAVLKPIEYDDRALRQIAKLGKILRALGDKND